MIVGVLLKHCCRALLTALYRGQLGRSLLAAGPLAGSWAARCWQLARVNSEPTVHTPGSSLKLSFWTPAGLLLDLDGGSARPPAWTAARPPRASQRPARCGTAAAPRAEHPRPCSSSTAVRAPRSASPPRHRRAGHAVAVLEVLPSRRHAAAATANARPSAPPPLTPADHLLTIAPTATSFQTTRCTRTTGWSRTASRNRSASTALRSSACQ